MMNMREMGLDDFEHLVRENQRMVYLYVLALVGEHFLAEDLAQETFVRAYASADLRKRAVRNVPAWLRGTARHVVCEELRRSRRHPVTFLETVGLEIDRLMAKARESGELLGDALKRCCERLTERARALLGMRYGEGLSAIEIGKRMGKSQTNVNAILSRIRAELRECIKVEMKTGA